MPPLQMGVSKGVIHMHPIASDHILIPLQEFCCLQDFPELLRTLASSKKQMDGYDDTREVASNNEITKDYNEWRDRNDVIGVSLK